MLSIAVIGGGAAGFMAAITAKRQMPNAHVCIFEKGKKVLAKVAVTGGGRCNIKLVRTSNRLETGVPTWRQAHETLV